MPQPEILQSALDISDIFKQEDSLGRTIFDSDRHVIPGALIGSSIAVLADSLKHRRKAIVSTAYASAACAAAGVLYEGGESCNRGIPNNLSALGDSCKEGFLDHNSLRYAKVDATTDVLVTAASGTVAAAGALAIACLIRRKLARNRDKAINSPS